AAHEAVPVDDPLLAVPDLDLLDLARRLRREDDLARAGIDAVARHEERAAADRALRRAEEAALLLAHALARGEVDRAVHPGELAGLGDDLLAGIERDLEDRGGVSLDFVLHVVLLFGCRSDDDSTPPRLRQKAGLTTPARAEATQVSPLLPGIQLCTSCGRPLESS